jgi:predicted nucleic acid-binding Zn ribbon protein
MDKAGDLLGRVARKIKHPEAPLIWLSSSWPQIVGKTLAAHTRPLRCQGGRLEIGADAKPWQKQLEHMARDFCERINHAWGSTLIREVKFVARTRPSAAPNSARSHAHGQPSAATAAQSADPSDSRSNRASTPPGSDGQLRRLPYELDNDHIPFIRRRK